MDQNHSGLYLQLLNYESINSIFDLSRRTPFRIPRFQRGFSWDKENIEEFWDDLKSTDKYFFIIHHESYLVYFIILSNSV